MKNTWKVVLLLTGLLMVACGDDATDGDGAVTGVTSTITMRDNVFVPSDRR